MTNAQSATHTNTRLPIITLTFLIIAGLANAVNISTCPLTLNASTNYTMTANASCNGVDAYTISGANVELNCQGFSVIGNNTTSKYGVIVTGANTTIKNCNFVNFSTPIYGNTGSTQLTIMNTSGRATTNYVTTASGIAVYLKANGFNITDSNFSTVNAMGILFSGAKNGFITNTNVTAGGSTASYSGLYFYFVSDNNTVTGGKMTGGTTAPAITTSTSASNRFMGVDVSAAAGDGYDITSGASNLIDCQGMTLRGTNTTGTYGADLSSATNTVQNCIFENWGVGVRAGGASNIIDNVTIRNQTSTYTFSTRGQAIHLTGANNIVKNSYINISTSGYPIISSAYGNDLINNTISSDIATTYLIRMFGGSGGSKIQNNTFITASTGGGIYFDLSTGNVQTWMCWNNFTGVTGTYINDMNDNNTASCLIDGYWEGNFYPEVVGNASYNGSPSSYGTGWYAAWKNATTVGSKLDGVTDLAPMTNNNDTAYTFGACNDTVLASNSNTVLTSDMFANGTNCYTTSGTTTNVTLDCNGYSIRGLDTTSTSGFYSGSVVDGGEIKNCNILGFGNGMLIRDLRNYKITNNSIYTRGAVATGTTTGSGYGLYGYTASGSYNTTVSNNTMYSRYGWALSGVAGDSPTAANRSYVANNTFYGGVTVQQAEKAYTSFLNNYVSILPTQWQFYGYYFYRANNLLVDCQGNSVDAYAYSGTYGYYQAHATGLAGYNNTIKNCRINNPSTYGIAAAVATGDNFRVINNTITGTSNAGGSLISIGNTNNNVVEGNTLTSSTITTGTLMTISGSGNVVENNTLSGSGLTSGYAISASATSSNFTNNSITLGGANGNGMTITGANNIIDCLGKSTTGKNVSGTIGISLTAGGTTIRNCEMNWFGNGLYMSGVTNSNVINSNFSGGAAYGAVLVLGICNNNTFSNNIFNGTQAGLYFYGLDAGASQTNTSVFNNTFLPQPTGCQVIVGSKANNNSFYNNNFTGTSCHAVDVNGSNNWNLSEGNIWNELSSAELSGSAQSSVFPDYKIATGNLTPNSYPINNSTFANTAANFTMNQTVTANSSNAYIYSWGTAYFYPYVFNTTTPTTVTSENLTGTITITPNAIGSNQFSINASGAGSTGWIIMPPEIYEIRRIWFVGAAVDYAPLFYSPAGNGTPTIYSMVGTPYSWVWKQVVAGETIPSGTKSSWTWRVWTQSSGRMIINGTSTNWSWINE